MGISVSPELSHLLSGLGCSVDVPEDVVYVERVIRAREVFREVTGKEYEPVIRGWSGYNQDGSKRYWCERKEQRAISSDI